MLNESARTENEPLSVELVGERRSLPSCDVGPTRSEADMSGASEGVAVDGKQLRKLQQVSEHKHERSKPMDEENSPGRPGEEPDDLV
jgi:hypothetical protein